MQLGPGWFIFIDQTGRTDEESRARQERDFQERLKRMRREEEELILITLLEEEC